MKNILLASFICVFTFTGCKKDKDSADPVIPGLSVEEKNQAILLDFSETWCPPCGSHGGPAFDSCLAHEGSVISAMKVYASSSPSSLNSTVSNGWNTSYNVTGVPAFYINNEELIAGGGVYSSVSYNVSQVLQKANAFAATPVVAGVAMSKFITGDSITVTTLTKFFKASSGNYKLGIYITESDIIAFQSTNSGTSANYEHHNLLRACNASVFTGADLNGGTAITAGQQFENSYKMHLKPAWDKTKLKVVAILWKIGSTGPPKVVNSNVLK